MRSEVSLTVLAVWLAAVSASSLSLGPLPRTEHDLTEDVSSAMPDQKPTEPETRLSPFPVSRPSSADTSGSTETGRGARLFLPRRKFARTCATVLTQLHENVTSQLNTILETLNSNNHMLTDVQASILQTISGQMGITTAISNLGTDPDQLDDIQADIETAKNMILSGQNDINSGISDLDSDVQAVKTMILAGQTGINNNIGDLSTALGTAKDMITDGQDSINSNINDLDNDLQTAEAAILAGQTGINDNIGDLTTALGTAKGMITDGQDSINSNINDLDNDLQTAEAAILAGQTGINDNIGDLTTALGTAKTMITNGQDSITSDISDLSSDLSTAKSMILTAISDLDADVSTLSTNLGVAKSMIMQGQTSITSDIADISTQLQTTETSILTELTTIDGKLDALETGQQEICDKIDALDVKLDTILAELMNGGGGGDTCPAGATLNNGACFAFSSDRENYADALSACQAMGGSLATMTADNAAFLYGLADGVSNDKVWIGLTRASGSWAWEDGSAYGGFTDWQGGEPSRPNRQCGEAEATSSTDGFWNDQPCTSNRAYICQLDVE